MNLGMCDIRGFLQMNVGIQIGVKVGLNKVSNTLSCLENTLLEIVLKSTAYRQKNSAYRGISWTCSVVSVEGYVER